MRVLITQPAQDAAATAAVLRARGHDVVTAPLLTAQRLSDPKINLSAAQGFVVTGGEGARALADNVGVRTFPVFTDSETTAALLSTLGFKHVLTAKDDTADLARLVERSVKPSHGALIHACHNGPATNLGALLGNMGFALRPLPLYSLKRVGNLPVEIAGALRDKAFDAAVFFSPEEARAFVALAQQEKLDGAVAPLAAVAASPVVAAPLRVLKFKGVTVPAAGTLDAVAEQLDGAMIDKVEQQRAAAEARAREEADRERAAEAARQAKIARQEAERAERERQAEEQRRKRELAAREEAERKRLAEEQVRAEQETRAKADREARERDRAAREQAAKEEAERKRVADEKARAAEQEAITAARLAAAAAAAAALAAGDKALREARAEEDRARKEAKERERLARELAAKEEAERRRIADEKARVERDAKREQQRVEDEARATAKREADEKTRRAREQAAAEAAERKRIADEQARAERDAKPEQQRIEDETRAPKTVPPGPGSRMRAWMASWFATPAAETAMPERPSWAMVRETAEPLPEPATIPTEQSPEPSVAPTPASATMAPEPAEQDPPEPDPGSGTPAELSPRLDIEEPPEDQMTPEPAASPPEDAAPETQLESSSVAPIRSAESMRGGRAARLLAEDADDDKARGQRFRNYSFGDGGETATEGERQSSSAPAPRRRGRAPVLFLLLVLLTAGGYFTSSLWLPKLIHAPQPPAQTTTPKADDVAALTARLRTLEEKAAPRPAEPAPARQAPAAGDDALSNQGRQVAALTARFATLEAAIGNAARLDEMNKRLSTLEGKSVDAASVLSIAERITALETAGRSAAGVQAVAVAYVMALGQWQNALAAGRPFALELETAKAIAARAGMSIDDAAFANYAAAGLPTLPDLRQRFDAAAAAAVRAAAVPDDTAGWLRRVLDRIMSLATIRRVDGGAEGASAWAIASRAEARMAQNDLAGAVAEMDALRGPSAEAAAVWTGPAKARVAAEHALADTTTKAIAAVAAAGDKPSN